MSIEVETLELPGGTFEALHARGPNGAARVLVLHGFPDHPPTFRPLMEALAGAGFDVTAPWMRGYAPSVRAGPYDIERLAHDLLELADAVSPDHPVFVIGHDWGAIATYVASALDPDRIRAAVTLAVPHPFAAARAMLHPAQLRRSWYALYFQLPVADERVAADDFAYVDRLWRDWSPGCELPAALRGELHRCLKTSWPAPLEHYRALVRPPLAAWHRSRPGAPLRNPITVPTMQIQGTRDGCLPPSACRGQERWFQGPFRAELIVDAGHFLQVEATEAVADLALEWFTEHA